MGTPFSFLVHETVSQCICVVALLAHATFILHLALVGTSTSGLPGLTISMAGMLLSGSPTDFGKLIADETEKWGKVIRAAGIKAQ